MSIIRVALLAALAAGAVGCASPDTSELQRQVRELQDQEQIRRVLVEYAATQDARDYEGYAALFAREGEWVNGRTVHKGREAIHQMLVNLYGTPPPGYVNAESYHLVSNPQVDVHGDRATARSRHLLVMRGPEGSPRPALAGRYEDEFIREDGQWKILRRVDYPVMPTAEEWLRQVREMRAQQDQ